MAVPTEDLQLATARWHAAADAYAAQLAAHERGVRGPCGALSELCRRLRQCEAEVDALISRDGFH